MYLRKVYRAFAFLGICWGIYLFATVVFYGRASLSSVPHVLMLVFLLSFLGLMSWGLSRANPSAEWFMSAASTMIGILLVSVVHLSMVYYPGFPDLEPPISLDREIKDRAIKSGVWLDKRSKMDVLRDFRKRGVEAIPAFLVTDRSPWDDQAITTHPPLPLGSQSQRFVVHCNESGIWSTYWSDEKGFNNPLGTWSEDRIDVMLLGDSFVHGACVDEGEDYGSLIRQTGKSVLNLGQRGNGPLLNLAGLI